LAHDPRVLEAARDAVGRVGLSSSASRETSGNTPEHAGLEAEVTEFIAGPEAAGLLLPDGYTANLAAAQALAATHAHALIDDRAHASVSDAAKLAGFEVHRFPHRRPEMLAERLRELSGPAVVMTDGVFTADGDVAPAPELLAALREEDRLLIDDCHGFCVLGPRGRGTCEALGVADHRLVITTTLAKGLGCGGGIVVADPGLITTARRVSTAYVCTTPVSPVVAAAGRAALGLVRAEPERVARLATNAGLLRDVCGIRGEPATPIAALVVEDGPRRSRIAETLRREGMYVPLMEYPSGPAREYFRISVTSAHTEDQIRRLGRVLAPAWKEGSQTCLC
jgi:7-keto-8-aminopelargonate synthetase-like enzyme